MFDRPNLSADVLLRHQLTDAPGRGLASTLLAAAIASVSAFPVAAQDAQEPQIIEEVIVTGYRQSILSAIDAKRMADTVAETLSADDLGSLPDVSMADALTRLPGISAVRTGGQAGEINIRGMAGGFVFTTLNGREQVSPSGSRSIEFDQYPSELISEATVYKSPKSSLIEGGVAGTVELKTANPLGNKEDHKFAMNLRGMLNDRADEVSDAEEFGHRISLSYQGKYANDTLGFAAGYARLYQPSVATQFVGLAYNGQKDLDLDGNSEFISEGFELQHKGGEETRDGIMAVLDWQPNDEFSLRADLYYSKFDTKAFARGFRVKTLQNGTIFNPVLTEDGAMIGGAVNRFQNDAFLVQTTNDDNTDYDEVLSAGLNLTWYKGPWTLSADLSTSEAESDFINGVAWSLLFEDASADSPVVEGDASVAYQLNDLDLPDLGFNQDYTDTNKLMLAKWGTYPYENTDGVDAVRFDVSFDFADNPFLTSIEAGVRYSDRHYTNDRSVFEFGDDFGNYIGGEEPLQLTDDMVRVVNFGGNFASFPSYLAIDMDRALDGWLPEGEGAPIKDWDHSWSVLQSGTVDETILAFHLMANLDFELKGLPITGNVGLRVIESEQMATGLQDVSGDVESGAVPIEDGKGEINDQHARVRIGQTFTDYLPSLNLNLHLTDNDQLRLAMAKVMTRPPINRLAADTSGTISGDGKYSVTSRNSPYLDPFYATQYDLSYEHYLEESNGVFVLALFYKSIESFINDITIDPYDFEGNGYVMPRYVPGTEPGNPDSLPPVEVIPGALITAVNNTGGGYIRGLEMAYTQTFDLLPGYWSGLGFSGSYSYTESNIQQQTDLSGSTVDITLPGLSETVYSATAFYDWESFSTRINVRYRNRFVSEQVAVETQLAFFDDETVVDYQASYAINDNLSVLFQVNNLTDEPTKTYFNQVAQTGTVQFFGRQYFLGVSYSL
jgi:iron complex outermembrane receptor protein